MIRDGDCLWTVMDERIYTLFAFFAAVHFISLDLSFPPLLFLLLFFYLFLFLCSLAVRHLAGAVSIEAVHPSSCDSI
ncbi:hypothetical protein J3F84DRAFT_364992 [Trichoderma pleuroticola]